MSDHRDVELRHLRYFVAVAEEGTVTEAARVLRITQPSLSQQIGALERRVGAPLFHRRPTGMELTEGGRILYATAVRTLAELEASLVRARDARRPVRVGVCRTVPEHLLARVERLFADGGEPTASDGAHDLAVEFDEADSQRQLDLLRTGALAFGVMRVFHPIDGLAALTLDDEPHGVALRPDHPLTVHPALTWDDLTDQELLWFPAERNTHFSEDVLAHLASHGWTPRLQVVDGHSQALYLRRLRTGDNLVGLRSRSSFTTDAGMAWRPLTSDPPRRRFILATPSGGPWSAWLSRLRVRGT